MTQGGGTLEAGLLAGVAALVATGERPDQASAAARDFDEAYTAYIGALAELPAEGRLEALQAVDSTLNRMTGPAHSALWTEAAIRTDPHWTELRRVAAAALQAFE